MENKNIVRGCGKRVSGGIYVCTKVGNFGVPLNDFLIDPPWVPRDKTQKLWIPSRVGLHFVENPWKGGVLDLWDWIGKEHYPFFPDFWEEVRRYGLSRRISSVTDFSKITSASRIIGFHANGYVEATSAFHKRLLKEWSDEVSLGMCPSKVDHEIEGRKFCVADLWQLVGEHDKDKGRFDYRYFPLSGESQFAYSCQRIPGWFTNKKYKATWSPAALFALPIHVLEIIHDPAGGMHELAIERIEVSGTEIPWTIMKE